MPRRYKTLDDVNDTLDRMHHDLHIIMRALGAIMAALQNNTGGQLSPKDQAIVNEIVAIEAADATKIDTALADDK
jgi:hypothetical protein